MSTRTIEPRSPSLSPQRPLAAQVLKKPLSIEVANPWRGRQTPCTAQEEHNMVSDLEEISGDADVDEFERRDVTVLITALRGGLTAHELLDQAPGARAPRLLAAHRELDGRRLLSEHAWRTIAVDPTLETFITFAQCAAELLPAVISHLVTYQHDEARLAEAIGDAAEQVNRTTRRVIVLERRLSESGSDLDRARELGTLLYDVYGQGAWSLPTFMPPRVATLVPLRLGALLGDDVTASRRAS
jgi:hypothetical protein